MPHPFHIVDVFAEEKYTGNQLAVVREAGDLSDAEMARIAAEMNYSETTFIEAMEPNGDGYPVRIFTPNTELPFAGHPTLGTAFVLRELLESRDTESEASSDITEREIALSLGVGRVPVTTEGEGGAERFRMHQPAPTFGPAVDRALVARVVSVEPDDLDSGFDPRIVSTGLPTLVVALRSLAAVRNARIDEAAYGELLDTTDAENVLVFCPETVHPEHDAHVRVFAPVHGVPEDPATGSSNGCLAASLARERFFGSPEIDVQVEQGYELDRPSLLSLRASDSAPSSENGGDGSREEHRTDIDVSVGGRVIPVAEGELL